MIRRRWGIQPGCILICAILSAAGPTDAVLEQATSVDDIERLEQAVFGPGEESPESEMRWRVAWALLSTGRDRAALRQFARLAGREPDAGGPKIGYALSAARLGDLTNAARAMRRVLRVDPDALVTVPIDSTLRIRLEMLRTQYMKRLARFDHDRDGAVMLAVVCCMIGEADTARYAIGYLTANGDRGPTTENLNRLINLPAPQPAPEAVAETAETAEDAADAEVADVTDIAAAQQPDEDPAEEPLDFTLVFHDEQSNPADPKPANTPAPTTVGATTEVRDPWAPASADSLNVAPPAKPVATPPATPPAIPPAPKPVAVDEVTERYEIDYDKLRDNLGSVGGALDSFTQKLIRNIAVTKEK